MTNPLLNKLAFNGYNFYYSYAKWNGIDLERMDKHSFMFANNGNQPLTVEEAVRYQNHLGRKIYCMRDDNGNLLFDRRDEWTDAELDYAAVTREQMNKL